MEHVISAEAAMQIAGAASSAGRSIRDSGEPLHIGRERAMNLFATVLDTALLDLASDEPPLPFEESAR